MYSLFVVTMNFDTMNLHFQKMCEAPLTTFVAHNGHTASDCKLRLKWWKYVRCNPYIQILPDVLNCSL